MRQSYYVAMLWLASLYVAWSVGVTSRPTPRAEPAPVPTYLEGDPKNPEVIRMRCEKGLAGVGEAVADLEAQVERLHGMIDADREDIRRLNGLLKQCTPKGAP